MDLPEDQLNELKVYSSGLALGSEGGTSFIHIPGIKLPPGCSPAECDALLCPTPREGYNSRLYFSSKISSRTPQNWNANSVQILGRNWFAFSWRTPTGQRLAQMVATHLKGLQ